MNKQFNTQFRECVVNGDFCATATVKRTVNIIDKFDLTCLKHGGECSKENCKEIGVKNE